MLTVSFAVPGRPVPLPRHRHTKSGNRYSTDEDKRARKHIAACAREAGAHKLPGNGTYRLTVEAIYAKPKRPLSPDTVTGADASNVLKMVEDALEGVVWDNDNRILDARCFKTRDERDETKITIELLHGG